MKITYDHTADALCILFKKGKVSRDKEISPNVFAGFDRSGELIEIQILDAAESEKPWITVDAAAKIADKSRRTIMRWIQAGTLKTKKVGKEYRIDPDELQKVV
jgi:excisionase family DNA binding protein